MRRYNSIRTPRELLSNRPTPLNKGKVKTCYQESEEETEPEDALNLMFDCFDK